MIKMEWDREERSFIFVQAVARTSAPVLASFRSVWTSVAACFDMPSTNEPCTGCCETQGRQGAPLDRVVLGRSEKNERFPCAMATDVLIHVGRGGGG